MINKLIENKNWFVYMVECSDKTIYTGITNDIAERMNKHNSGKGAKYTRSRGPVILKAFWIYLHKSEAAKAEHVFKKLTRYQKLELIRTFKKNKKNPVSI
jgi:putative endonuclease